MKVIFDNFDQRSSFSFFHTCKRFSIKMDIQISYNFSQKRLFVLFSRNPIEKPTRLTLVGTKISRSRLQNHTFSSFAHVYGVLASKWHHKFTIWCPTIPFWTPKWSQTSSASSAGRPSGLAEPGRPGLASQAAGPARRAGQAAWRAGGLLPGKGTREERRRGRSAQELMEPPHSYHRRWVILYRRHIKVM